MPYRKCLAAFGVVATVCLLAAGLGGQTVGTPPLDSKPAAKGATPKPQFKLYDWMGFHNQPDLRPLGFEPIWGVMDGTFNRATTPEADNVSNVDPERSLFAARRQAIAAAGVLPLQQNIWNRPKAYAKLPQDMVFDLEDDAFEATLDLAATSEARTRTIAVLCTWVDAMRDEARKHGHEVRIGSYFPIGPFAAHIHPTDPRLPELRRVAEKDFKPWFAKLDFAMPDCSIMGTDVAEWKVQVNQQVAESRRYLPGKPVYAELQLCYGHFAKDKALEGTLVNYEQWVESVTWLAQHPGIAGICLFGQDMEVPGADRSRDPGSKENGSRQLDYQHVEKYVQKVAEVGAKRRAADERR